MFKTFRARFSAEGKFLLRLKKNMCVCLCVYVCSHTSKDFPLETIAYVKREGSEIGAKGPEISPI